jgi:Tfp pilus assembly protein PilW
MTCRKVRQHGLSLVELLLGLAITALVLTPLVPMLQTASAASSIGADRLAVERDAHFALDRIATRIRGTPIPPDLKGLPADWLKPAVYLLSNGTLIEQQGGTNYVLAESVTAFSITAPAATGSQPLVQASITLVRGGTSTTASTTVRMGGLP